MSKHRFSLVLWSIALSFCFLQSSVSAKDEWMQVRSKNFSLIGNASENDIRKVATRLEQFREVFRQVLNKANFNSPIPTTVVVFKSDSAYTPYKPVKSNGKVDKFIAGYFQPGEDVNYITLPAGDGALDIIFHEYTHFIVDNNFGRTSVPPWFNEGLAEYYEKFKIADDRIVTLGALNNNHIALLRQNSLINFDTFFNIDDYTLHEQSDDGVGAFYAQAWVLMHYLIHGNGGARQKQMYKFLDLVIKNKTPKEAFAEAFQTDYATMEKELKKYIEQNSYQITNLTFKEKLTFDASMQTAPLTEADAKAYLGDLLYHTRRYTEAETLLQQSLTLNPNQAMALTSLGLVKMRQKNFPDAKKYLEKALQADAKNYLAQYSYAYVLSREKMDESGFVLNYTGETVEKMRAALKKAIELNPQFAESFNLYAFTSVVQNEELDEGVAYLRRALALAPGNQYYLIRLAELYGRKHDFAAARKTARRVFETAADASLKSYAQFALKSIDEEEAQIERNKNAAADFQNRTQKGTKERTVIYTTDKPLTEEEIGKMRDKAKLEAINNALRKPEAGERRILGRLTKINCSPKGITYLLKTDNGEMSFASKDFNSLILISYEQDMGDSQVGCGVLKKESLVVLTFRPGASGAAGAAKTAGEVVSMEFMPADFKLSN